MYLHGDCVLACMVASGSQLDLLADMEGEISINLSSFVDMEIHINHMLVKKEVIVFWICENQLL